MKFEFIRIEEVNLQIKTVLIESLLINAPQFPQYSPFRGLGAGY